MNKKFERQTTLIGKNAQEKLRNTKIGIVGLGGIGGPAIIALTYAGIDNFVLIDYDTIDISNLNRQILYRDSDIGRFKTEVAWDRIKEINPKTHITVYNMKLEDIDYMPKVDIWIDGLDNFSSRFYLNSIAVKTNTIYIHGAIDAWNGEIMTIIPHKGACLSCVFPKNTKKNENIQVLSSSVMMIGAIMANQAIKAILYPEKVIPGELILIDLFNLNIEKIRTKINPQCPVCGTISG